MSPYPRYKSNCVHTHPLVRCCCCCKKISSVEKVPVYDVKQMSSSAVSALVRSLSNSTSKGIVVGIALAGALNGFALSQEPSIASNLVYGAECIFFVLVAAVDGREVYLGFHAQAIPAASKAVASTIWRICLLIFIALLFSTVSDAEEETLLSFVEGFLVAFVVCLIGEFAITWIILGKGNIPDPGPGIPIALEDNYRTYRISIDAKALNQKEYVGLDQGNGVEQPIMVASRSLGIGKDPCRLEFLVQFRSHSHNQERQAGYGISVAGLGVFWFLSRGTANQRVVALEFRHGHWQAGMGTQFSSADFNTPAGFDVVIEEATGDPQGTEQGQAQDPPGNDVVPKEAKEDTQQNDERLLNNISAQWNKRNFEKMRFYIAWLLVAAEGSDWFAGQFQGKHNASLKFYAGNNDNPFKERYVVISENPPLREPYYLGKLLLHNARSRNLRGRWFLLKLDQTYAVNVIEELRFAL
eukprot:gb/GECG01014986.1/.p1 GENE.gb/GECG01014986.1/~~gb/GECG01014986.1/.p1  ORF type:complete len:469 (+),score=33.71 gb/GECG01014986.1/:1-1407(+)